MARDSISESASALAAPRIFPISDPVFILIYAPLSDHITRDGLALILAHPQIMLTHNYRGIEECQVLKYRFSPYLHPWIRTSCSTHPLRFSLPLQAIQSENQGLGVGGWGLGNPEPKQTLLDPNLRYSLMGSLSRPWIKQRREITNRWASGGERLTRSAE
jgi:hypothetical protein